MVDKAVPVVIGRIVYDSYTERLAYVRCRGGDLGVVMMEIVHVGGRQLVTRPVSYLRVVKPGAKVTALYDLQGEVKQGDVGVVEEAGKTLVVAFGDTRLDCDIDVVNLCGSSAIG